ncbi:hypothetical protein [Thomasclavelia cocleata]|uniref:hypothetical protein n=1 Tax=Thomasclavelia cocleata TaxID=69824 RepID=UPI0020119E29|nr:hypothetical protein [Thomasclavelia cocleata]
MKKINKFSYEIIIAIIGVLVIIGTVIILNLERIHLMAKGYSFSEQDIILKLEDEEVERFLESDKVVDIASWIKPLMIIIIWNMKFIVDIRKIYQQKKW